MTTSTYDVVVLAEQPLSRQDALNLRALHEGIGQPARYHLLLPVDDAAARVQSTVGLLGAGDVVTATPTPVDAAEVQDIQRGLVQRARTDLDASLVALREAGVDAAGETVSGEPVDALVAKVGSVGGAEVIVLTQPHVVAEFLHLDWTSRARRKLGVPVLHLLEHENFDEQAGGPEGISGF